MAGSSSCIKEVRQDGSAAVVSLTGEIDLHHTPEVHKTLVAVCDRKPTRLVVDLAEVTYIDSSGIGTLVEVFRRVNGYQGKLVLCGLNERVRGVFEITKLDRFFKICNTQAEALAA